MMNVRRQRIRKRAYRFWEEEGCVHGRHVAHWLRAETEEPLRVTFDTNALDKATRPERFPRDAQQPLYFEVKQALTAGLIKGYFSETLITLEGIEKKDRTQVMGSTRLMSQSSSSGPDRVDINISVMQDRQPVHREMVRRVQSAIDAGMHALRAPPRIGFPRVDDTAGKLFEPDHGGIDLSEWLDNIVVLADAISARGVGFSVAQALGLKFSEREAAHEMCLTGLGRARDVHEEGQVKRAIAEWADGDSVASHYAHANDLFCSRDFNENSDSVSVLSRTNRAWLLENYGIRFITIEELAEMVRT